MKLALVPGLIMLGTTLPASANLLSDLYQRAVQYDAQFQSDRARYEAALQARPQLRAGLLPSLTASGSATRQRDETSESNFVGFQPSTVYSTSYRANLQLIQPLFDWATFARFRQIDERIGQAQATYATASQDLILRTVGSYFDWLAAEDSLRFARAEKTSIEQQLRQARSRYEVGLSAITDVQEAQARFDLSRAQELAAASTLRSAREALRLITGEQPENSAALQTPLSTSPPEPANPDAWVEQALASNLVLKRAELGSRIAEEQVREQVSAHLPSLSLVGDYNFTDDTDSQLGRKAEIGTIGLQLQLPLFAGGANRSRVVESRHLYDGALADLDRARREARQLARDAYDGVTTGEAQVAALRQAVKSNEVALEAIQAGFNVGSRTSVDVLNAQRELFRAQRDLSRARYDYLLSVLRLKQSVGALDATDVDSIDALLVAPSAGS